MHVSCTAISVCVTSSVTIIFGGGTKLTVQSSKRIIHFSRTLFCNCLDWKIGSLKKRWIMYTEKFDINHEFIFYQKL